MSRKKNIDEDFVSGSFLSVEDDDDDCSIHSKTMDEDFQIYKKLINQKGIKQMKEKI